MLPRATLAVCLAAALIVCSACGPGKRPARLEPAVGKSSPEDCSAGFITGNWQLIHSIEIEFPGRSSSLLIGVVSLDAGSRAIDCVIMTVEGFVLFEAAFDGSLRISRAVAPFDSEAFAMGLVRDIDLIFFEPEAHSVVTGTTSSGQRVCRYTVPGDGVTIDAVYGSSGKLVHLESFRGRRLERQVDYSETCRPVSGQGACMPETIRLRAIGRQGYTLTMTLRQAVELEVTGLTGTL